MDITSVTAAVCRLFLESIGRTTKNPISIKFVSYNIILPVYNFITDSKQDNSLLLNKILFFLSPFLYHMNDKKKEL
ncbi:hypothetical protein ACI65C_008944 [Semiaphis heraclei]